MNELAMLAQFVAETQYDDLPQAVIDRAKWVIRDTVGVIIGGLAEQENQSLANHASSQFPGQVTLFGHGGRTTAEWAVLVHGTAGTTLEMDEGHAFARGHAAIHALPPAFALGEAAGVDGRELLTAFILGYEVAARAGVGTRLRKPVHPFGAWGVLGAAAIAARLKGMQADDITGVLEAAASYAITPSFETAYQGANIRNTYAGMVNRLGLLAADMYGLGYRGERGGVQTTFGEILGQSFDSTALTDGLGERYEIMRGYFKPYSGCRYTHAAIDAVLNLLADHTLTIDDIETVDVETYDIAAHLSNPAPQTPLAGRFSTPYVVAATLVNRSAGPEIFTPAMLKDSQVLSLASRVNVREEAEFTAMTPHKRPARVTLHFSDTTTRSAMVTGSKGDPDQPMSDEELQAKFHQLVDPVVGDEHAAFFWDQVNELEQTADLSVLLGYLHPLALKGGEETDNISGS